MSVFLAVSALRFKRNLSEEMSDANANSLRLEWTGVTVMQIKLARLFSCPCCCKLYISMNVKPLGIL